MTSLSPRGSECPQGVHVKEDVCEPSVHENIGDELPDPEFVILRKIEAQCPDHGLFHVRHHKGDDKQQDTNRDEYLDGRG